MAFGRIGLLQMVLTNSSNLLTFTVPQTCFAHSNFMVPLPNAGKSFATYKFLKCMFIWNSNAIPLTHLINKSSAFWSYDCNKGSPNKGIFTKNGLIYYLTKFWTALKNADSKPRQISISGIIIRTQVSTGRFITKILCWK